ncbi:MAG: NAD(P)/FAD-dependent oxidoreductase [Nitrospina sp.]|jgi:dihydrolipoamide dehydrogenase|nr:NAD(P)/FAD-dependent oxidoreductase [Nitrospina sp.]
MDKFDVLVLGGGFAGVSAALRAAELGSKVCLIEKGEIGRVGFQRRNALFMESRCPIISSINWDEYKMALEAETEIYCLSIKDKLDAMGVSIVKGEGRLANPGEISVQSKDKGHFLLKGKSVILACGSSPRFPSTLPHEDGVVISLEEIPQLPALPEKILVIGEGPIACETALGLQRRGCKVFLCSEQKNLFSEMDEDFNVVIERLLKEKKIKILAGKKMISFYKNDPELEVTLETGIKFSVHLIIIAGDRVGGEEVSEIEKLGIRLGEHQKVFVDEGMMTSLPTVYAVGSITGELTSDTLSKEEGKVAAENALGKKRKLNREWVPQLARLCPDVAYVGCNMETAGRQGFHPVEGVFESEFSVGEKLAPSPVRERCKIVADKRTRLIVGVQIISNPASDWITMLLLLIKKGVTVANLANVTYPEGSGINCLCEAARHCLRALKAP